MAFLDNTGVTRLVTDLKTKFATLVSGAVDVTQGGTGKTTHTANAVITGNGTSAVNNVATADGALYATAANGAAQFGTLPVAQGGTAGTTEAEARESLEVPVNASIATVESATATANHAIGDHFMLDDKLKTATAAIATGETINATNSADDTVQEQIDALRDSLSPYTVDLTTRASAMTFPTGVSLYAGYQNTATLIGNIVVLKISIRMENATSEGKSIQGYLPEDLWPSRNVLMACETGLADGKLQPASMNSDGALAFWSVNTGKTTYAIGSVVYVI